MVRIFLLLILDHLRHRPFRSLLTIGGVAIGIAAWLAIRVANGEVYQSFEDSVTTVVGEASITISGGPEGVDEQVFRVIQNHPGVKAANPIIRIDTRLSKSPFEGRTLVIWGVDLLQSLSAVRWKGSSGSSSTPSEAEWQRLLSSQSLFVEEKWAQNVGAQFEDLLEVEVEGVTHQLRVAGFLGSGSSNKGTIRAQALMDIAAVQWMFGWLGRVHQIAIVPVPGISNPVLIEELQSLLPSGIRVSQSSRRNNKVESMLQAFQLNLTMLSGIGLLVGIFLMYNTMAFSVAHHRREIGILRSLGMERAAITTMFLIEAGVLGLIGGGVGCILGVVLAEGLMGMIGQSVNELYGVIAGRSGPPGRVFLSEALVIGVGISLVGAFRPAWDASSIPPVQALGGVVSFDEQPKARYRSLTVALLAFGGSAVISQLPPITGLPLGGYVAAFLLLIGGTALGPGSCRMLDRWRGSPDGWKVLPALAGEQIGRNPKRTSVTMAAIIVGIAIMVGVGIMIQSFRETVERWIEQTLMADIIIAPVSWLGEPVPDVPLRGLPLSLRPSLTGLPGVKALDLYREGTVDLDGQSVSLVSRDLGLHAAYSQYLFIQGDSSTILRQAVQEEGVIVSEVLANRLSLVVGEALSLRTEKGVHAFPVLGIFYDYATDGGKVVMDDAVYTRYWGDAPATVFSVYLDEGQSLSEMRRVIEETLSPDLPIVTISNGELKDEILEIFDRTFQVTYVLELIALCVAVLGIVNTLTTAILERRRELATMRALGASSRQIQGLVFWESGYIAGLGGGIGMGIGLALSYVLIEVINKQSFGWTIQFSLPWPPLAMALAVAMLAALVGALGPARWASRQVIADGLRYE